MTADDVRLDTVDDALASLAAGKPVAVVDDAGRENEGDLILSAQLATPETVAFLIRYTSGVLCAPLPGGRLDALALPPMTAANEDPKGTAYSVSVDARAGITTGISAADRARTANLLASDDTDPHDLTRPGHVFPLRAAQHGVFERRGHTEAAVDLTRLAGLVPAGVIGELTNDDGSIMDAPSTREFANEHGLAMISIADLVAHRYRVESPLRRGATVPLPSSAGNPATTFQATAYVDQSTGDEHLAITLGLETESAEPTTVRVHSECLTGDVFGSRRCDCGAQLDTALAEIAALGRGAVVYLRGHEGRGIGLFAKLQAYALQDAGLDTVDANTELGLPVDSRQYHAASAMLRDLGTTRIRLLTHNPAKAGTLRADGIDVAEVARTPAHVTAENLRYLKTKHDRLGHTLDLSTTERHVS
ncbi:3,4-dihydroxy-2-butanone-4-phosphate synthase [Spelaeicoccus albus]|uniref:GTP cyclohydrolase-2 n=1 Tax=Spelaeicoccus albus TaxID=1280376 RepID=A0A7Z0D3P2_9MICO|nr:3,4-dihydroxy-2-butanone-4-phosphate synthase [Spelaeicoccus albus]NYI68293.1 3,4-dihydroxy 2-butanone 4-phosphate synthase/GTP cyclohydrolase II [Spelaeicoccus albus]